MKIELISINVSQPKTINFKDKFIATGIFKTPINGTVKLTKLNLEGDGQADLQVHGGLNKAIYVYPFEHYDFWKKELNRDDLSYGQFGENFTILGVLEDQIHIGDIFRIGSAVLEVTQPRMPCYKLGIKMQLATFPKKFLKSGRIGFYMKVLEEGEVKAKESFEIIHTNDKGLTIRDLWHLVFFDPGNTEDAIRALKLLSLGPEWRQPLEQRLVKAGIDSR